MKRQQGYIQLMLLVFISSGLFLFGYFQLFHLSSMVGSNSILWGNLSARQPAQGPAVKPVQPPQAQEVKPAEEKPRTLMPEAKIPVKVKGIYATGYTAGSERMHHLIHLIKTTELNAIVIDIKDDTGLTSYASNVPLAQKIGANQEKKIGDIDRLIGQLVDNNIYPIARIVVFKDPVLAEARPDLAVRNKRTGGIWRDYAGMCWADPYSREVWDYNIALAKEAAMHGFREIQFDYVRFPSDGVLRDIAYDHSNGASEEDTIAAFLQYAREQLAPYNVFVSADIFGLVTSADDDVGIGQKLEKVAMHTDYVCPMVYPSHYYAGTYGLQDPDAEPYRTVLTGLTFAKKRLEGIQGTAVVRPWLQDFSLRHRYGPEEIRAQIQAVTDAGYTEWILWNPANVYTESALYAE